MITTEFECVSHFQKNIARNDQPNLPKLMEMSDFVNSIEHLRAEINEMATAYNEQDLPGVFDALVDLVYVAKGGAYLQGLPWGKGWEAVHQANMEKVNDISGVDGKRGVRKPKGWVAPNLEKVVDDHVDALKLEQFMQENELHESAGVEDGHIKIPGYGVVMKTPHMKVGDLLRVLTLAKNLADKNNSL